LGTLREFRGQIVSSRTLGNFDVIEIRYPVGQHLAQHCHDSAYISIALAGSYSEECGSVTCDCTTGLTVFHASGESHSNHVGNRGARLLNLMIHPRFLRELRHLGVDPDSRNVCASPYCMPLAMKLRREAFLVDDPVSGLAIEGLAMELCAEIFRRRTRDTNRTADWLCEVDRILRDRFREQVTLTELAGMVQVHPVHLARAFRKRFGCCVGEQIRKLRIEAACRELQHSQLPIAEIAAQTGFSDQSHLSRTLKRHTGMSPHQFRVSQATGIDPRD